VRGKENGAFLLCQRHVGSHISSLDCIPISVDRIFTGLLGCGEVGSVYCSLWVNTYRYVVFHGHMNEIVPMVEHILDCLPKPFGCIYFCDFPQCCLRGWVARLNEKVNHPFSNHITKHERVP
jgi:hypothetical protein